MTPWAQVHAHPARTVQLFVRAERWLVADLALTSSESRTRPSTRELCTARKAAVKTDLILYRSDRDDPLHIQ